eukprot:TRINITY_DN4124_c0_g1_i1.p1 TRINITY_DN4124_c0_g1~~TRINITY_DN4124_c0_g1_i1.p1  ORF type:complete len:183 (-),score=26.53 TRINITY_DN4124_c0_g1_i1:569-1117(-)
METHPYYQLELIISMQPFQAHNSRNAVLSLVQMPAAQLEREGFGDSRSQRVPVRGVPRLANFAQLKTRFKLRLCLDPIEAAIAHHCSRCKAQPFNAQPAKLFGSFLTLCQYAPNLRALCETSCISFPLPQLATLRKSIRQSKPSKFSGLSSRGAKDLCWRSSSFQEKPSVASLAQAISDFCS